MSLFLLTFFLIYGSVHLYAFFRVKPLLPSGPASTLLVALIMVFMVVAPVLIRLAERAGYGSLARVIGYVGYTWMGLLFLFFSASLVVDIFRLSVFLAGKIRGNPFAQMTLSPKTAFFLPLFFSLAVGIYGYFEGKHIRVERISIKTAKIPEEIGTLRIVQISDLHLGLIEREERLKRVMKIVKRENPHMFVATGDLVDGQMFDLIDMADLFNGVEPKFGKFAVTGNHEFYAGLSQALAFTEKAGFKVLRGEAHTNPGVINVAGVDDPAGNYYSEVKGQKESEILADLPRDRFTILLKHRPVMNPDSRGLFDLQLSGHTHKGQIFPFVFLTRLYYPDDSGMFNSESGSRMYVSRGTGTWGPPIRFLAPPEITVITLIHEDR